MVVSPAHLLIPLALLAVAPAAATAQSLPFRCGIHTYVRPGASDADVTQRCGEALLVIDAIDARGRQMQYWKYYADPERYRSAGTIEIVDGKVGRALVNETVSLRCGSKRALLGDSSVAILGKCGRPPHAQALRDARGVRYQEWFYGSRGRTLGDMRVLIVMRDTLVAIENRQDGGR